MESATDVKASTLRLLVIGGHVDIKSPLSLIQFYRELSDEISKRSSDPTWNGWHAFTKDDGKQAAVNVMHIIGVEEI